MLGIGFEPERGNWIWGARPPRAPPTAPSRLAESVQPPAPFSELVHAQFGAGARRTAAGAAALPSVATASFRIRAPFAIVWLAQGAAVPLAGPVVPVGEFHRAAGESGQPTREPGRAGGESTQPAGELAQTGAESGQPAGESGQTGAELGQPAEESG